MILTPYQSTACKKYSLASVVEAVVAENINDALLSLGNGIYEVGPSNTQVDVFTQPLCAAQFGNRKDVPAVVIDARSYTRASRDREGNLSYSNPAEADFQKLRAKLQIIWQNNDYNRRDLLQVGDIPAQAFFMWVGRTLSGKLGLDPEQSLILNVVCAYYYNCMFYEEGDFTEDTKLRVIQTVSRQTRLNAQRTLEILEPLDLLTNVNELIGAIHKSIPSPRVEQINLGFLFSVVRGSWFGANGSETVCVALEHPPTFIALVHSSLELRSFRNYTLAKVVQNQVRSGNDRAFVNSLAAVLKSLQ